MSVCKARLQNHLREFNNVRFASKTSKTSKQANKQTSKTSKTSKRAKQANEQNKQTSKQGITRDRELTSAKYAGFYAKTRGSVEASFRHWILCKPNVSAKK